MQALVRAINPSQAHKRPGVAPEGVLVSRAQKFAEIDRIAAV